MSLTLYILIALIVGIRIGRRMRPTVTVYPPKYASADATDKILRDVEAHRVGADRMHRMFGDVDNN